MITASGRIRPTAAFTAAASGASAITGSAPISFNAGAESGDRVSATGRPTCKISKLVLAYFCPAASSVSSFHWRFSVAGRMSAWIDTSRQTHDRTHAPQQTSDRAFPAVSFGYLSVECPLNKFYGIIAAPSWVRNCSIASFIGGGKSPQQSITRLIASSTVRSISSICNFTVGSRHSAAASSPGY